MLDVNPETVGGGAQHPAASKNNVFNLLGINKVNQKYPAVGIVGTSRNMFGTDSHMPRRIQIVLLVVTANSFLIYEFIRYLDVSTSF